MARIAIIGTGISGLSAAWLLHSRHDITVYEKETRVGGHSRTVTVRHDGCDIPVDTGFIVFNTHNYPNLTALFRKLGVATKSTDMSFGLSVDKGRIEWGARGLNAVFGQRSNLLRPNFYKMIFDVIRFNASAVAEVERGPDMTLGELLARMKMGDWFRQNYLLPMAGAIWSCPPQQMLAFPARPFIRFFANHQLLTLTRQRQWLTVVDGAQAYVEKLSAPFRDRIRLGCGAARVTRLKDGVEIVDTRGDTACYDEVVMACHADEALAMLADASTQECAALGAFGYQRNVAVLHNDASVMPNNFPCWASWVYHSDSSGEQPLLAVTYWMNNLQGIDPRCPLFVTLNPSRAIAQDRILDRHVFSHPVFDFAALEAQSALKQMNGRRNTWFCGAHLGSGFHEDGLVSAMRVAEALGGIVPWNRASALDAKNAAPKMRAPSPALGVLADGTPALAG